MSTNCSVIEPARVAEYRSQLVFLENAISDNDGCAIIAHYNHLREYGRWEIPDSLYEQFKVEEARIQQMLTEA